MGDTVSVKAQICLPDSQPSEADSCNNVQLLLSRDDLQNISTDNSSPYLGDFNSGYLGTGVGLVLAFYLLGYGLGQVIKMVNLR